MMALDDGSIAGTGFDDVRINRSLSQEIDRSDFTAFVFEDTDKFFTNDFPLPFRIADAFEFAEEAFRGIDADEVHAAVFKGAFDFIAFVLTKEAMVDEDAGQLTATAFEMRAAATELSTPPERASTTLPSPTVSLIEAMAVLA